MFVSHFSQVRLFLRLPFMASTLVGAAALLATPAAHAQTTFYTSRTIFTTANPGLTGENFENTTGGTDRVIDGRITSTTAGNTQLVVAPGFSVQAVGTTGVSGSGLNQFFYNSSSSFNAGNGTNVLTTNSSKDSQDVTFSSLVNAFGVDLGFSDVTYTISVYNTSGMFLGATNAMPTFGNFLFVGVTSTADIGRVNINANNTAETTDNFLFGRAPAAAAPEPGTLPLLGMGLASGMGTLGVARRRKATKKTKQAA